MSLVDVRPIIVREGAFCILDRMIQATSSECLTYCKVLDEIEAIQQQLDILKGHIKQLNEKTS